MVVSKPQIAVPITGGSTSEMVPVCIVETVTPPPVTSKYRPVCSTQHQTAKQHTEQRSAYTFVANQGRKRFVLVSLGQQEVKREERPEGFLSCTWCLLTARGLSQAKVINLQIASS